MYNTYSTNDEFRISAHKKYYTKMSFAESRWENIPTGPIIYKNVAILYHFEWQFDWNRNAHLFIP